MLPNHLGFILCLVTYLLHLVYPDNISTTYLVVNPINHARTKHLKVALHFVHERVASRDIRVKFVSSSDHVADILTNIFTKRLSSAPFALPIWALSHLKLKLGKGGVTDNSDLISLISCYLYMMVLYFRTYNVL